MILPADSRCFLPAATVYRPGLSDTAAAGNLLSALVGQFRLRLVKVTGTERCDGQRSPT